MIENTSWLRLSHPISLQLLYQSYIPLQGNWFTGLDLFDNVNGYPFFSQATAILQFSSTVNLEVVTKQDKATIETSYYRKRNEMGCKDLKTMG